MSQEERWGTVSKAGEEPGANCLHRTLGSAPESQERVRMQLNKWPDLFYNNILNHIAVGMYTQLNVLHTKKLTSCHIFRPLCRPEFLSPARNKVWVFSLWTASRGVLSWRWLLLWGYWSWFVRVGSSWTAGTSHLRRTRGKALRTFPARRKERGELTRDEYSDSVHRQMSRHE